jgi:flagellar motor switch protein FliM
MYYPDDSNLEIEPHSLVEAKISTGRYRWLDLIARRWSILLEDTLYSELRMISTSQSSPVVWTRFEDLCDPMLERPIFIFETKQKGKALLLLETDFVRSVTSSSGIEDRGESLEEMMKNHQKKILAMVRPFIRDFERSWTKIGEYPLELKRITTHPKRAQVMLPFERCLVFQVELVIGEMTSSLTLGIPFSELHTKLSDFENSRVLPPESLEHYNENSEQELLATMEQIRHDISAKIGTLNLSSVIEKLEVGQILPIESDGKITVEVNGIGCFHGSLGSTGARYSVQIQNRIQDKFQSPLNQEGEFKTLKWTQS